MKSEVAGTGGGGVGVGDIQNRKYRKLTRVQNCDW